MRLSIAKCKRSSYAFFLLIALMLVLQACDIRTAGKSIQPPSGRGFAVERSVNADRVSLQFFTDPPKISQSEIVLIAEKVPDGSTIVPGSATIPPDFSSDTLLVWLFAKTPPVQLGSLSVSKPIPTSLTYRFTGTGNTGFIGKYGLKEFDEEGLITDAAGVCTQVIVCGTDGITYTDTCGVQRAGVSVKCQQACPCPGVTGGSFDVDGSGTFDINDVFVAINNYVASQGSGDVGFVFSIINAYVQIV
ncbi:hypothetical protein HYV84_06895 [Candidatus Woesearchaeota archaeon]|nr:hypothetical protein [Candidatus Woesearchaeota archaeon]